MPRQVATPKQTSGDGFTFEDKVVAYFFTHLLTRSNPFVSLNGVVEKIETQRPASEWHLDDVVLKFTFKGNQYAVALSIKSNQQITGKSFPADFVEDTWHQLLNKSSDAFNEQQDFMGIITSPLDSEVRISLNNLLRLSRDQEPKDLAFQIKIPQRVNEQVRKLFESARCPEGLAKEYSVDIDASPGRLLRKLVHISFDFDNADSKDAHNAVLKCQNLLESGTNADAKMLWNELQIISRRIRGVSGSMHLEKLLGELRANFNLKDFPDHNPDWKKINAFTKSSIARIESKIGGKVSLSQEKYQEFINAKLETNQCTILIGASGIGKSVLAKFQAEKFIEKGKTIWFEAEQLISKSLADWQVHLDLSHPLSELLSTTPTSSSLIVLDGLDRIYSESGIATVAEILNKIKFGTSSTPWKVIITCTPDEWARIKSNLVSYGFSFHKDASLNIENPDPKELEEVWESFPVLRPLSNRLHLGQVIYRPKVLDLLASSTSAEDELSDIGESYLFNLFWNREVLKGANSVSRSDVAKKLAEYFADNLKLDISTTLINDVVDSNNNKIIDELVQDRILTLKENRLSFDHDLYADWVRAISLNDLNEAGQLLEYLEGRINSPVWHRAIRLFGIYLLEKRHDISLWLESFDLLGELPSPSNEIAQDILLESTAFSIAHGIGLLKEGLWSILEKDNGKYLLRLLNRLFHSATIPDELFVNIVSENEPHLATYAASESRIPYWPYWVSIIHFLYQKRHDIPLNARGVAGRFVNLWLRTTTLNFPLRDLASEIAIELGEKMLLEKEKSGSLFGDGQIDQIIYKAVIGSSHNQSDKANQIILEASGKRDQRFLPEEKGNSNSQKIKKLSSFRPLSTRSYDSTQEQWKNGPKFRVDGALQKLVFTESHALDPLFKTNGKVAGEVILGLFISEPKPRDSFTYSVRDDLALEWPNWHNPFYTKGPFLSFLQNSESEAIDTIIKLINHASNRWRESVIYRRARDQKGSKKEVAVPSLKINVDNKEIEFLGDSSVFNWINNGIDSGGVIKTVLVSLEKYLYDQADAGKDLEPIINKLLNDCNSLSIVGVLSLVGKRHPQYLSKTLRGILFSPYVLWYSNSMSNTTSLMFTGLSSDPLVNTNEYKKWHKMPHRQTSLIQWAQMLFLNSKEIRNFGEIERKKWIKKLKPGGEFEGWTFIENLVSLFDFENYELTEAEDGNTFYQYNIPNDLKTKNEAQQQDNFFDLSLTSLPLKCKRLIEQNNEVDNESIEEVWQLKTKLEESYEKYDNDFGENSILINIAVAALLIFKGEKWLKGNPKVKEWAQELVVKKASRLSEEKDDTFRLRLFDDLEFIAYAIPMIWIQNPSSKSFRQAIAEVLFSSNFEIVGITTSILSSYSQELGDDHLRVIKSLLHRSKLEYELNRMINTGHYTSKDKSIITESSVSKTVEELNKKLLLLKEGFIDGRLGTDLPLLDDLAPTTIQSPSQNKKNKYWNRRRVPNRRVSDGLLVAAFKGIPNPGKNDSYDWFEFWVETVEQTFEPYKVTDEESSSDADGSVSVWERYLIGRTVEIIAQTESSESQRRLWEPILKLGLNATNWVEWFLKSYTPHALYPKALSSATNAWLDMIDFALKEKTYNSFTPNTISDYKVSILWRALLGFQGFGSYDSSVWNEDLKSLVDKLTPYLSTWVKTHLNNSNNVKYFAQYLTYPAASDLLYSGLIWLYESALKNNKRFWSDTSSKRNSDQSIFMLLNYIWQKKRNGLKNNPKALEAFRGLLEFQVSRQYSPSMELSTKVGNFGIA